MTADKETDDILGSAKNDLQEMLGYTSSTMHKLRKRERKTRFLPVFIMILLGICAAFFLCLSFISGLNPISQSGFLNLTTEILGAMILFLIIDIYWDKGKEVSLNINEVILTMNLLFQKQKELLEINTVIEQIAREPKSDDVALNKQVEAANAVLDEIQLLLLRAQIVSTSMK